MSSKRFKSVSTPRRAQRCEEQAAELEQGEADDFLTPQGLAKHRVRARPDGTPHPKAQRNFVDPDSRIMEHGGTFLEGYNCCLAVDEGHQIIVAQAVTNQCPDNANLIPLLEQVHETWFAGSRPSVPSGPSFAPDAIS